MRELWVVKLSPVQLHGGRHPKATTDRVILEVEHGGARRRIPVHQLLDEQEDGRLPALWHVHLDEPETLDKRIDYVYGQLLALVKHNLHALQEGHEVFVLDGSWKRLLKHALDHCVQG